MIKNLFRKANKNQEGIKKMDEEYIELSDAPGKKKSNKLSIYYCVLNQFTDVKKVLNLLRDGSSMCIIKIKQLRDKDINDLKRAISKVKRVCEVMDGDLVGMDEDYLIAHPNFIKICKGK